MGNIFSYDNHIPHPPSRKEMPIQTHKRQMTRTPRRSERTHTRKRIHTALFNTIRRTPRNKRDSERTRTRKRVHNAIFGIYPYKTNV